MSSTRLMPITFEEQYRTTPKDCMYPPPRDKWVRIEERENESTPCPAMNEGSFIMTQRVIFRTGYWLGYKDMPEDELQIATYRHIANASNRRMSMQDVRDVLLDQHPLLSRAEDTVEGPISPEMVPIICDAMAVSPDKLHRHINYQIRSVWLAEQKQLEHPQPLDIRTFWYLEFDRPVDFQVDRKVNRQVGQYGPAYSRRGYYDDYDEYEGPYLNMWISQPLYHVGYYDRWEQSKDEMLLVHPLDVIHE